MVLAGCGRAGYDPMVATDAGQDASVPVTAEIWANPSFTMPEGVSVNTDGQKLDPYLSADMRRLYFAVVIAGQPVLYVAERADRGSSFGTASSYYEDPVASFGRVEFTVEGLVGVTSSERPGGVGNTDIYSIRRNDTASAFDTVLIPGINHAGQDADPHLALGGTELWWSPGERADGIGGQDIFRASRPTVDDPFGAPQLVAELSSTAADANATLSADGTVVVLASSRPASTGSLNVWYATRASPDLPFSNLQELTAINDAEVQGEPFLSVDGCEVFAGGAE